MSASPPHPPIEDLPRHIPIFPLAGCILLPEGRLPLNIFEDRYLEMCRDVLASHRVIGMVQPSNPNDGRHGAPVYETGCAGRITSFTETDDKRYLITLTGLCRFMIVSELPVTKGYRRVRVNYDPFASDLEPSRCCGLDRARLVPALKAYFEIHGLTADWDAVRQCPSHSLITSLAMICPFDASEKQALLETKSLEERSEMVLALIEMAIHENRAQAGKALRH